MGGEERARAAERSGLIWANALQNIGQTAGQAIGQYSHDKEAKAKEAKIAERDAALLSYAESWDGKNPNELMTNMVRIGGPDEGMKWAKAVSAINAPTQQNPESAATPA